MAKIRISSKYLPSTLKELAVHQIGSKINVYKSAFLRSGSGGGPSSGCPRIPNNMSFASVRSTRRRYFRERDEGDPPAVAATENSSKARIAKGASASARASRFSLLFSLEDLTTDSTSVLKVQCTKGASDVCHKNAYSGNLSQGQIYVHISLKDNLSRRGSSSKAGPSVRRGRPPQLDRSVSCVTKGPAMLPQLKTRTRYLSEGHGGDEGGGGGRRTFSLKGSRFKLIPPVMATDLKGEGRVKEEEGEGEGGGASEGLLAVGRDSESAAAGAEVPQPHSRNFVAKVRAMLGACFDPYVLRDPVFVLLTACVCTMTVGAPHLLFFLPAYAVQVSGRSLVSFSRKLATIWQVSQQSHSKSDSRFVLWYLDSILTRILS